MIKLLLELIDYISQGLHFVFDYAEFLSCLAVWTLVFVLLSKSIKKHAKSYYWFFGTIAFLSLFQSLNWIFHFTEYNLFTTPVLGKVLVSNIHLVEFGFPLLVIIMYVGALSPKQAWVKKLLSIRKEMSIISGFPVLLHSLVRITANFTDAIRFFSDKAAYMEKNEWAINETGLSITNSGYLLGIVMFVLFLILWITSFGSVHKKLGARKWKQIQKWSYLLYGLLFLHSILLHTGWLINPLRGGGNNEYIIKEVIAICSTILVFGSYLFLRIRKARKSRLSRQ
ncbi:ferric reductase-like transmembrane domain-containing protein [Massilibacteroides sp.]|uniref:ferric reductase-like transmembrane domain-containing protein n=1 Tax=Massilibacteroides sp. TaxID=2034766 RepID=UPI0026228A92|nr:ferric reductase-like transmembrane domain-containing protein [Massilibacteroides sp.]MDD4513948.1 ferric reductase-like transmembrane domain-containing protein [Massilibacteroides sp.]